MEQIEEVQTEDKPKPGRKKKEEVKVPEYTGIRDRAGLINDFPYEYDQLGLINWKNLVPKDSVVLNRAIFANEGINVDVLNEEELEKIKDAASENRKLIKLNGFKFLARLRGIKEQEYKLVDKQTDSATVSCSIEFIENFENTKGLRVTAIGQASLENTDKNSVFSKYLEMIASNRAFVRCVKEALNIQILGADEIPDEKVEIKPKKGNFFDHYMETCKEAGLDFVGVIQLLKENGYEEEETNEAGEKVIKSRIKPEWVSHETLAVPAQLDAVGIIKRKSKDESSITGK